jgi:hypothetical protein
MNHRAPIPSQLGASFRDPSGFLFERDGVLYRQVNHSYEPQYKQLQSSGLLQELRDASLLIPHEVADVPPLHPELGSLVLQPERVGFISYPYEWCFTQLRDAALLTLDIALRALRHDMTLKDASAYNVQFHKGQAVFIDTLSFEKYQEGSPWVAYRQFCQHFLAPLALMSMTDVSLNQLFRTNIDGVPLALASSLLPFRSRLKLSLLTHIHLHARTQAKYAGAGGSNTAARPPEISRHRFQAILDNLQSTVRGLSWKPEGTEWGNYYSDTNYDSDAMLHKQELVRSHLEQSRPRLTWDLGANTGVFSRIAAEVSELTVSFDIDPAAVEKHFIECRRQGITSVLPLLLDLTNPSAAIGWHHRERDSLLQRGPADTALALALVHHLAISNNLPFPHLAAFFADLCTWLIIEFVPKSDSQVQRLLASRQDVFPEYDQEHFEAAFGEFFDIQESTAIRGCERILYRMRRRSSA